MQILKVCCRAAGSVDRRENRVHEILDVDEVPFHRATILVEHDRNRLALDACIGLFRTDEIPPARTSEHILAEGELCT